MDKSLDTRCRFEVVQQSCPTDELLRQLERKAGLDASALQLTVAEKVTSARGWTVTCDESLQRIPRLMAGFHYA